MKLKILAIFLIFAVQHICADSSEEKTTEASVETTAEPSEDPTTSDPVETTEKAAEKVTEKAKVDLSKNSNDSCNPWPSKLKSPAQCCDIPHNPGSITLNTCFYRCSAREMDERRQLECGAGCFVNTTGILIDGRLNRERVKNMFVSGMFPSDRWLRVMEDAIDTCDFNDKASLHGALAMFYSCVHDYLGDHCVSFIQTPDCEKTQELFEDCNKVRINCDYWPRNLASPEYCCKIPPLFSQTLTSKCRHECAKKELFVQRQQRCIENCLYNDTKLRVDGNFNYNVVLEMLIESSERNKEWRKPIEQAVERCKKAMGENNSRHQSFGVTYEITTLQTCLRDYLSTDCAEFKDESYCRKVKHFVKHCPNTKPRKHYYYYNNNGRPEAYNSNNN